MAQTPSELDKKHTPVLGRGEQLSYRIILTTRRLINDLSLLAAECEKSDDYESVDEFRASHDSTTESPARDAWPASSFRSPSFSELLKSLRELDDEITASHAAAAELRDRGDRQGPYVISLADVPELKEIGQLLRVIGAYVDRSSFTADSNVTDTASRRKKLNRMFVRMVFTLSHLPLGADRQAVINALPRMLLPDPEIHDVNDEVAYSILTGEPYGANVPSLEQEDSPPGDAASLKDEEHMLDQPTADLAATDDEDHLTSIVEQRQVIHKYYSDLKQSGRLASDRQQHPSQLLAYEVGQGLVAFADNDDELDRLLANQKRDMTRVIIDRDPTLVALPSLTALSDAP